MWRDLTSYLVEHGDVILPIFTLLALAVAGFRTNQRRERREFTQRLMAVGLEEHHMAHADYLIYKFMMRCQELGKEASPDRCLVDELSDELQEALRITLNYYQQIAASYQSGILDPKFVLTVRGVYIRRLFRFFEPYIETIRKDLERPELYKELEALAKGDAAAYERKVMAEADAAPVAN